MTDTNGAALVVNARARNGQQVFERTRDRLAAMGIELAGAHLVVDPADLAATARRALDAGCGLLVVGGGDGTLSAVCGVLAGTGVTLGVIPLGTANDFARTLGIPSKVDRACEVVAGGRLVDVDLGLAGTGHYLNVASIGFGAAVAGAMPAGAKRLLGPLAYPLAALRAAASARPFTARLTFPLHLQPQQFDEVLQIAVGNGRFYGGGRAVSATAGIDDAALDVYVITKGRLRELLRVARRLRSGAFWGLESVTRYRTAVVTVETGRAMALNVDGELRGHTPVRFSVARNALKVLVPAGANAVRLDDEPSR